MSTGLAFNSRRSYSTAVTRYIRFCQIYAIYPLFFDEHNALRFIAYLDSLTLLVRTIKVYLSGVRAWLISQGQSPPFIYTVRVKWALRSLERSHPEPRRATPVSYSLLALIQSSLYYSFDNLMIFAAMTLGYFACLRAGEYCYNPSVSPPLLASYISFHVASTPYFSIKVKSSKTSLKGFSVIVGCTRADVCAHCTMQFYLHVRPFPQSAPLFLHQSGQPLTHRTLSAGIKAVCSRLGLDPQSFTPHSLRAGSATDAAAANLPDTVIQRLGRWRSHAYSTYVRPSLDDMASIAHQLAHSLRPL